MPNGTATADYSDQRRSERDEVFLRTTLSYGKKIGISGQLVNISPHGCMIRTLEPFTAESMIRVLLPQTGEVAAQVKWALGGRIGCAFETPFSEPDYARLLAAIKSARPNWQFAMKTLSRP